MERIYRRYVGVIWRFALARLGADDHAARDVVAETFLAAIRGASRLPSATESVAAWLMGIARHKLADHCRRQLRNSVVCRQFAESSGQQHDGPLKLLLQDERRTAIFRALAELPDEERLVLEWKYLEDRSVRDIATQLSRTEKAVESILYRARIAMRLFLTERDY